MCSYTEKIGLTDRRARETNIQKKLLRCTKIALVSYYNPYLEHYPHYKLTFGKNKYFPCTRSSDIVVK